MYNGVLGVCTIVYVMYQVYEEKCVSFIIHNIPLITTGLFDERASYYCNNPLLSTRASCKTNRQSYLSSQLHTHFSFSEDFCDVDGDDDEAACDDVVLVEINDEFLVNP